MAFTYIHKQQNKKEKKRKKEGSLSAESWQWNLLTPISNKT